MQQTDDRVLLTKYVEKILFTNLTFDIFTNKDVRADLVNRLSEGFSFVVWNVDTIGNRRIKISAQYDKYIVVWKLTLDFLQEPVINKEWK